MRRDFLSFGLALAALFSAATTLNAETSLDSSAAVESLKKHLETETANRPSLDQQPFAKVPLTKSDAEAAEKLLWEDHVRRIRQSRAAEIKDRKLVDGKLEMPFYYEVFDAKPEQGRSLFLSMHGGGNATKAVNDQQWENQKRLYKPPEGVYLAPRAPTNTWNLWHEPHIDRLFDRLIEDLIVFEDVSPNRVYVMGYSAGGDGVYQLGPRMADRWAAAAMMAGHPNDASPLGLRNVGFTIHVGGNDSAYNRNRVAGEWGQKLDALAKDDPDGYAHLAKLHAGKPHWMDREDAEAVPWMMKFTRDPLPKHVVWKQDDVTHPRFYWLAVDDNQKKAGTQIVAKRDGQKITIDSRDVDHLTVRLNDRMANLDQPISVEWGGKIVFEGTAERTIAALETTIGERGDPTSVFSGEIEVHAPPK